MFVKEAHLTTDVEVCDNVDLETILLEYSDYYYAKFNKYPRICKRGEASFTNISWVRPCFNYFTTIGPFFCSSSLIKNILALLFSNALFSPPLLLDISRLRRERLNKIFNKNQRKSSDESCLLAAEKTKPNNNSAEAESNFNITVTPLFPTLGNLTNDQSAKLNGEHKSNVKEPDLTDGKFLKPLGNLYPVGSEWREIAYIITQVNPFSAYSSIYPI